LTVPGDVVISFDADLQDDLAAIEPMLDAHAQGSEIVFGVRRKRDTDTFTKRERVTATGYYHCQRDSAWRLFSIMRTTA
jgi:polyisoprenyl-phosphate glycosyltransferase